jgi:hypothetical protein
LKSWTANLEELDTKMASMSGDAGKRAELNPANAENQKLDNQIRATRKLYKEFKGFLQEFLLTVVDPVTFFYSAFT